MSKTSDEKIASMKQYWRDGYSVPEIASMVGSSKTTVKKYLSHDIEVWLDEHNQAKERRAKAELVPEPVNFDNIIIDDGTVESEQTLSDSDFMSLIDYEFSQAHDYESVKDIYDDYKEQAKESVVKVEYFRQAYEQRINSLSTESNTSQPQKKTNTNSDEDNTEVSFSEGLEIKSAEQTQQTIKAFKSKYQIKIPVPRLTTLQKQEWQKPERVFEHLAFWYIYHFDSRKAACQFISGKSLIEYQQWFSELEQ